jgi:hypothetical protein
VLPELLLQAAVVVMAAAVRLETVFLVALEAEQVAQGRQFTPVALECLDRVILVALQIQQERIQQVEQVAAVLVQLV